MAFGSHSGSVELKNKDKDNKRTINIMLQVICLSIQLSAILFNALILSDLLAMLDTFLLLLTKNL
jgi:hypothetical protein